MKDMKQETRETGDKRQMRRDRRQEIGDVRQDA